MLEKLILKDLHIIVNGFILMLLKTYIASLCLKFGQAVRNVIIFNQRLKKESVRPILRTGKACLCDKGSFLITSRFH